MNQFAGIWKSTETHLDIELTHSSENNYLLSYFSNGISNEESIQIMIESEAAATVSSCERFSNGIKNSQARMYIISDHTLIIAGEGFQRFR